jgi:hypothetical protein
MESCIKDCVCVHISSDQIMQQDAKIQHCFLVVAYLAYSSTLKMEAICSSEKQVNLYHTAWLHIPGDSTCSL